MADLDIGRSIRSTKRAVRQMKERSRLNSVAVSMKEILDDPLLTDEEKQAFRTRLESQSRQGLDGDLGSMLRGPDRLQPGDLRQEIADLTRSRRQQANLTDLRNRLTQVSGFAGIQQRRTAATRQLSPGQDNASRKGTSLITSRS